MDQRIPLLNAKLCRPRAARNLVIRPRLFDLLDRGLAGCITLICAPAGFGKTTLVSSWLQAARGDGRQPLASAWLSLDADDSNLVVFVRYLLAALRSIDPGLGAETEALIGASQDPPLPALAATLSNEISTIAEPFVLVLDDYEAIQGNAVHELINAMIQRCPPNAHLILIARHAPPFALAGLRARGLVMEIRAGDLRFVESEIATYLDRTLPALLSPSTVARFVERTEGWIAGLYLTVMSVRAADDTDAALAGSDSADGNMTAYLVEEVVDRQPAEIQDFLLKTSILDSFCEDLCAAVAGGDEGAWSAEACLLWVERANLFITSFGGQSGWYRYHLLFRDLLQRLLRSRLPPEQVIQLHRSAAHWYAQQGLIDQGLQHALAAHDFTLATRLIRQGLNDALNRQDRATLERWLRLLPEEVVGQQPWLLLLKAFVLEFAWRLRGQMETVQQMEALDQEETEPVSADRAAIRGSACLFRSQEAYFANRPDAGVQCAQDALALLPPSWSYARGGAELFLALNMQAQGEGDAVQHMIVEKYETLTGSADAYSQNLLFALGMSSLQMGRLEQAQQAAGLLLACARANHWVLFEGWAHYMLGIVHYHRNDMAQAIAHFQAIADGRYSSNSLNARVGIAGLGLARRAAGERRAAQELCDQAARFDVQQWGRESGETSALRAILLLDNDLAAAGRWADAFTDPPPDYPLIWLPHPHLTRAHILLARGDPGDAQAALSVLDALNAIAIRTHNIPFGLMITAYRGLALDAMGQAEAALAALQRAVELARPGGFVRDFVDCGLRMQTLLKRLAAHGFATDSIARILAAFPHANAPDVPGRQIANPRALLIEPLTNRELDVLVLLRDRLSDKEIARQLTVSPSTVKSHTKNLFGKLGASNRREAVTKAEDLGILPV